MLKTCDEVCGKRKGRRDEGDTVVSKKDAHKEMYKSRTEANKARYQNMKNQAKKVVAKAMKEAGKRELRGLSEHLNKV